MSDRKASLSRLDQFATEEELELLADVAEFGILRESTTMTEDEWGALAVLSHFDQFHILQKRMKESWEKWMVNFAHGLANSDKSVDQREVDYKRGYWKGANYYLNILPKYARAKVAKAARDNARKERDSE